MALLINEALIRPSMTDIQEKALEILQRFWYYFPSEREKLYKPVMILITNLCLFGSDKGKKEATVFLYHIIQRDRCQPMIDLLKTAEEGKNQYQELLKPLLTSKYYTPKALAYPDDVDRIYNLKSLDLNIGLPLKKVIEAGSHFVINFTLLPTNLSRKNHEYI